MAYEVIPFKVFMAPPLGVLSYLDGGLAFFAGAGVALFGLIILEKFGITFNEKVVRWMVRGSAAGFVAWCVLKSGLFRHLLIGF